ncbi:hypothetical protein GCM10023259_052450 [Thermocatellispora tengchongensis]
MEGGGRQWEGAVPAVLMGGVVLARVWALALLGFLVRLSLDGGFGGWGGGRGVDGWGLFGWCGGLLLGSWFWAWRTPVVVGLARPG